MKYLSFIVFFLVSVSLSAQEKSPSNTILANADGLEPSSLMVKPSTKINASAYFWKTATNEERKNMPFYKSNFNPKDVNFYITSKLEITLNWIVDKERQVSHYEIERFGPSGKFELIQALGAQHHSEKSEPYSFYDFKPLRGINNYRVVQVLQSGERKYSKIYKINCDRPNENIVLLNSKSNRTLEILIANDEKPISIFFFDENEKVIGQHSVKKRGQILTTGWTKGLVSYDILGDGYEAHGLLQID